MSLRVGFQRPQASRKTPSGLWMDRNGIYERVNHLLAFTLGKLLEPSELCFPLSVKWGHNTDLRRDAVLIK